MVLNDDFGQQKSSVRTETDVEDVFKIQKISTMSLS